MGIHIRAFQESDRAALRELYTASRRGALPWRRSRALQLEDFDRDTARERIFVAEINGTPVGFASIWEPDNFLHNLFVHPSFQRRGVGKALIDHCMGHFTGFPTLKCVKANVEAVAFYHRLGWQAVGDGDSADGPYFLMAIAERGAPFRMEHEE